VDERKRGKEKTREGVVVSDKMDKTVVVRVERLVQHPKYKKYLRRRLKVKAHDARNACGIGDRVLIAASRPLSRDKRWTVRTILEKAQ
jgi:small subunit ribosomal protein S17